MRFKIRYKWSHATQTVLAMSTRPSHVGKTLRGRPWRYLAHFIIETGPRRLRRPRSPVLHHFRDIFLALWFFDLKCISMNTSKPRCRLPTRRMERLIFIVFGNQWRDKLSTTIIITSYLFTSTILEPTMSKWRAQNFYRQMEQICARVRVYVEFRACDARNIIERYSQCHETSDTMKTIRVPSLYLFYYWLRCTGIHDKRIE